MNLGQSIGVICLFSSNIWIFLLGVVLIISFAEIKKGKEKDV